MKIFLLKSFHLDAQVSADIELIDEKNSKTTPQKPQCHCSVKTM